MAFQAAAMQGISASTADMIPSFSRLSAPWRALANRRSTTPELRVSPPEAATPQPDISPDVRRVYNEACDILATHPRFRPSVEALRYDYSLQNLVSQGLRQPNPRQRPSTKPNSPASRSYSTFGPFHFRSTPLKHAQTRAISNGQSSQNLLAHMEQTANNNPQSASSQNAFYSALLRANMPDILVERYETGRYATNAACDAMYYRALDRLGQAASTSSNVASQAPRGTSQEQLQAVSKAIVASQRGLTSAAVKPGQGGTGAKESPLHVFVDESRKSFIFRIARFLILWGTTAYLSLVVISFALETTGIRRVGGSQNAEVKAEAQKTRFSDVKGCDEAIEELREIVDFLKKPEKYNSLGGKLPKGVLMVGPPGTGKTLLARAVAGEAGVPFFYMSGSEFDEVYVGVGAKRVRELFANAKSKAPAIVFIDELDAVGGKRNERDASYHMQTLNQMLTELDGFDQTSGVVFIGATNFPQMLDKALTRPGRFDRQVVVPLPDVRGRIAILKYHMRNMQVGSDVDSTVIARGTPGFSGADIENLVNQAAVHAGKNNKQRIGMIDLDWARDRIIMGAEKRSMVIQDKDKLMTAYHEAGHALMGHFTGGATPLYKVTILPRGQALGVTHFMPDLDKVSQSKREILAQIDTSMGGKVAEELIYGVDEVTSGCSSDLANATRLAYHMVCECGMSDVLGSIAFDQRTYQNLSTETKHKVEAEVRKILDESQDRARRLLGAKRNELELLARGLLKHETLTREEMFKIINGEELPERLQSLPGVPIKIPEIPLPTTTTFGPGKGSGDAGKPPQLPGTSVQG